MTNHHIQGVNFQVPPGGQISDAVDNMREAELQRQADVLLTSNLPVYR